MKKKGFLIIAGSLNFFIALLYLLIALTHVMKIGAPINFMGASSLPEMILYSVFFIIAGLYAFASAGEKIKLPMQRQLMFFFSVLFTFRGFSFVWFLYCYTQNPESFAIKEIIFSLFSLTVGILYWFGSDFTSKKKASLSAE